MNLCLVFAVKIVEIINLITFKFQNLVFKISNGSQNVYCKI